MSDTSADGPHPTECNRLDEEASPYLRQHADNPVNWQPWGEQALESAREHEAPIFLSIGYSACHWCHVMEEESFADPAVAAILNEHFVPIKVDREERPDLDSVYMSICQQVTGRGGWPLSAWLTPEGEPFYVGTYFPPDERGGMPAFADLLERIAGSWNDPEEREDMRERASQWTEAIENDVGTVPDQPSETPDESVLTSAADTAVRGADREYGGWGGRGGPKFPQPCRIELLFRGAAAVDDGDGAAADASDGTADDASDGIADDASDGTAADAVGGEGEAATYRDVATRTLDAMVGGGLYDHLGGGFHRYCTDRDWTVPHFEKMLYDNAEISRVLLAAHQLTGEQRYATAVEQTIAFLERELRHPDGGFYSTLDARSEGESGEQEEGAFYVWTPEAVEAAVDDETAAAVFRARYGVTDRGNFEGDTVLTITESVETIADQEGLPEAAVRTHLETAASQAFDARAERPRPARDEKVLVGWNGLAISMLAEAALVLEDDAHAEMAADALAFVREHCWDPGDEGAGTLARRYKDGDVSGPGYLEDYAFLARGALYLYGVTGDVEHLAFALDLGRAIESEFWDAEDGTLYFTPRTGESLVARPQELTDQSTPSSAGVAAVVLDRLAHVAPDAGFETVVEGVLATHGDRIRGNPMQHASLVLAADEHARGQVEVTLAADGWRDGEPTAWRETLANRYVPRRFLAPRPAEETALEPWLDELDLDAAPPIWADRGAVDAEPTVYVCRNFACSPPTHDLGEALSWALETDPST